MGSTKGEFTEHQISEDQLVIAEAVLTHARANYNHDGWDYIVECYSRRELAEIIDHNGILTVDNAITYMHGVARRHQAMREDVSGESF